MKIDPNLQSVPAVPRDAPVARGGSSPQGRDGGAQPGAAPAPLDGDATHLSHAALQVSSSASLPEVRVEKVAAVQQALAGGSYAVSPSDVAGKLIDHLLQN
jgi:negative regulator of flagellin synthesis FlgM